MYLYAFGINLPNLETLPGISDSADASLIVSWLEGASLEVGTGPEGSGADVTACSILGIVVGVEGVVVRCFKYVLDELH